MYNKRTINLDENKQHEEELLQAHLVFKPPPYIGEESDRTRDRKRMRILLYGFLIHLPASILPIQIVPWWSRSIDYNKNPLPRASFAGFGLGSRETVKCSVSGWEGPNCEFPICENGCGVHGKCVFPDICRCEIGYIGKRCHECIKHPECHNGNCIEYLDCNCYPGWTGRYCATPACRDGCSKQFGSCKVPGECVCLPGSGYQGENCTQCTRMQGCDHGYCNLPNECICEEGWTGTYCDTPVCKDGCSSHGYCRNPGECICKVGYRGELCDVCVPYPNCENGFCIKPWQCLCDENWSGVYCNETSDLGLDKPMSRNSLTFPLKPNLPQPRLIKKTNLDLDALVASILAQSSKAEIAKPSSAAKPVIAEPSTTSPTTKSPTTTTALPTTEKAPSTSTMLVTSDSEEDEYSEESEESEDSADTPNALDDLPADLQGDGQGGLGGFRRRPRRRRKRVKGKSKAKSKGKKGKFRNPAQAKI